MNVSLTYLRGLEIAELPMV